MKKMENKKNGRKKMGSVWQCVGRATGRKKRWRKSRKKNGAAPKSEEKDKRKNENEKKWKSEEKIGDESLDVSGMGKRDRVGGVVGKGMGER